MGDVVALPLPGRPGSTSLPDVRGEHRALQVTWHDEDDVVVVSTWRFGRCVSSVRLTPDEAAALIATLAQGLARRSTSTHERSGSVEATDRAPRRVRSGVVHRPTSPSAQAEDGTWPLPG